MQQSWNFYILKVILHFNPIHNCLRILMYAKFKFASLFCNFFTGFPCIHTICSQIYKTSIIFNNITITGISYILDSPVQYLYYYNINTLLVQQTYTVFLT
jgi:hypothetical protein